MKNLEITNIEKLQYFETKEDLQAYLTEGGFLLPPYRYSDRGFFTAEIGFSATIMDGIPVTLTAIVYIMAQNPVLQITLSDQAFKVVSLLEESPYEIRTELNTLFNDHEDAKEMKNKIAELERESIIRSYNNHGLVKAFAGIATPEIKTLESCKITPLAEYLELKYNYRYNAIRLTLNIKDEYGAREVNIYYDSSYCNSFHFDGENYSQKRYKNLDTAIKKAVEVSRGKAVQDHAQKIRDAANKKREKNTLEAIIAIFSEYEVTQEEMWKRGYFKVYYVHTAGRRTLVSLEDGNVKLFGRIFTPENAVKAYEAVNSLCLVRETV